METQQIKTALSQLLPSLKSDNFEYTAIASFFTAWLEYTEGLEVLVNDLQHPKPVIIGDNVVEFKRPKRPDPPPQAI